jgi:mannose-6-phosphate isomerase-like protein (cupin superfamily)
MPLIRSGTLPNDNLVGETVGASVSVILDDSGPGAGPRLHRHPYDETWVVVAGTITFVAGDETFVAEPGDIVVVPPETPHKFTNTGGGGPASLVCIHANPTSLTEWLEPGRVHET